MNSINKSPAGKPNSIGGWLLVFSLILVAVWPAITLVNLAYTGSAVMKLGPTYPRFVFIFAFDATLTLALVAFGIFAGISLLRLKPGAPAVAGWFLLANAIVPIVATLPLAFSDLPAQAKEATILEALKVAIGSFFWSGIWGLYLLKSLRVRRTFSLSAAP